MQPSRVLTLEEVCLRLGVATLLGAAIGLNRELRDKPAGLRTHALVSLGSALVTLTMIELSANAGVPGLDSVSRVIQGLIAGVGFIGGGVILHRDDRKGVRGLTTAASIWLVASLGVASGAGEWRIAIVGVALCLLVLSLGGPFERLLKRKLRTSDPDQERVDDDTAPIDDERD